MSDQMIEAFYLLAVGMVAVFSILGLVALTGRILIQVVNQWAPTPPKKSAPAKSPRNISRPQSGSIQPETLAVLVAAVDEITKGKGQIKSIKKA